MADTGSFPVVVPVPVVRAVVWSEGARSAGLGLVALLALGAIAAAAGLRFESEGYGALTLVGGAVIGIGMALPAWLLLRRPRSDRRA